MNTAEFLTLDDVELDKQRVLIRVDFNVPITAGSIDDDTRIRASLPSIEKILAGAGKPIIMSHLGRPEEGKFTQAFSLRPVAEHLASLLGQPVRLCQDWRHAAHSHNEAVIMLENIRFEIGEKDNADALSAELATLCDIYVNDAFATAHRAQASTHGVAKYAPVACAGPLLIAEVDALSKALSQPRKPVLAIVGGAKVSSKLIVLENLLTKVDKLILGGGIANTFLLAAGYHIGQSLLETELLDAAKKLLQQAAATGKEIPLPTDVVCAKALSIDAQAQNKRLDEVADDDLILDVGPETVASYRQHVKTAATILWNGPLGVFEFAAFSHGTEALARAVAASDGFSIAGGGDTLSAIAKYGISEQLSYISTGGGAFLEFLEGKTLPAIDILQQSKQP